MSEIGRWNYAQLLLLLSQTLSAWKKLFYCLPGFNPPPSNLLELLERVLLRLGCVDTDEQLENTILKFLPPVLEKITSPHEAVRLKVMEVLTHINKRLKARPMIQVPVKPILELYLATESSYAMVKLPLLLPRHSLQFPCLSRTFPSST